VDEFEEAGLTKLESLKVAAKRVAESPIQLECEYVATIRLPGTSPACHSDLVIGRVVMIHIDENYILPNGKLDILKLRPLSRLGYADYTSVTECFEMSLQSMKDQPIPGSAGWMSPPMRAEKATHNL
jgi:flavin reductase (DIM6/NTAB) family NADH-FMN oxidoreductase RutF